MGYVDSDISKQDLAIPARIERTKSRKVFLPRVDIYETSNAITIIADMPGVDENSVEVTVEKNVLKLTGNVEQTRYEGHGIAYAEYDIGDYERVFAISNDIDRDKIDAVLKNGVLRLTLHKTDYLKTKKVEIRAA
jgi:HSP20 family molecular chaperone IbpA